MKAETSIAYGWLVEPALAANCFANVTSRVRFG